MKMITQGDAYGHSDGQIALSQQDLLIQFMKFDDKLYLEQGYTREQVDSAIAKYDIKASD